MMVFFATVFIIWLLSIILFEKIFIITVNWLLFWLLFFVGRGIIISIFIRSFICGVSFRSLIIVNFRSFIIIYYRTFVVYFRSFIIFIVNGAKFNLFTKRIRALLFRVYEFENFINFVLTLNNKGLITNKFFFVFEWERTSRDSRLFNWLHTRCKSFAERIALEIIRDSKFWIKLAQAKRKKRKVVLIGMENKRKGEKNVN